MNIRRINITIAAMFALCAGFAVHAGDSIHKAIISKNSNIVLEYNVKKAAESGIANKVEKLNLDRGPRRDIEKKLQEFAESFNEIGLNVEKDIVKLSVAVTLTDADIKNIDGFLKNEQAELCLAIDFAKAIDPAAANGFAKKMLAEDGKDKVVVNDIEIAGLAGLELFYDNEFKMYFVVVDEGRAVLFGNKKGVFDAIARFNSSEFEMSAALGDVRASVKPASLFSTYALVPGEVKNMINSRAEIAAERNPMEAVLLQSAIKIMGVSTSSCEVEEGTELSLAIVFGQDGEAGDFKSQVLDAMVLPAIQMFSMQYSGGMQLDVLSGMRTVIRGKAACLETVFTYKDLKTIADMVAKRAARAAEEAARRAEEAAQEAEAAENEAGEEAAE